MKPRLELLRPEDAEAIVAEALEVLERVGVYVENSEAQELLAQAGADRQGQRFLLGEAAVRQALASAPATVTLYDRQGEQPLVLGDGQTHFVPGSAALYLIDPAAGRRPGTARDCLHLGRLTERCPHLELQATAIIPGDVGEVLADRYRLYAALRSCRKPIVTGTFCQDGFAVMHQLLCAVRGGAAALRARPLAIFDCAPTPPLQWSDLTGQALLDCARAGVPAALVSMPMAGASAPVTLREAVVQHCAENLSGLLIHQLAAPGAPVIYGGSPTALDMRHGTTPMGAAETMMIDLANAQIGRLLGLPTHAYLGPSDAKTVDFQAGVEAGWGTLLASLGGVDLAAGAGMMDFQISQSWEKLVLDNEVCGAARRVAGGISRRSAERAPELLAALVQEGSFLGHPHTLGHFKKELYIPGPLWDRANYEGWASAGGKTSLAAAAQAVQELLDQPAPAELEEPLAGELRALIEAEARRCGQTELPPY